MHSAVYPLLTVARIQLNLEASQLGPAWLAEDFFTPTFPDLAADIDSCTVKVRLIEGTLHCASRSLDGNM